MLIVIWTGNTDKLRGKETNRPNKKPTIKKKMGKSIKKKTLSLKEKCINISAIIAPFLALMGMMKILQEIINFYLK